MTDGDILKRDDLIWGFTLDEIRPYLEHKVREVTMRNAILQFLGVEMKSDVIDTYCQACRAAGRDHCDTCDKGSIEVVEQKKDKRIGKH